ncbi:hypothetical protein T459_20214 [Capsicum annuum]|uniref:Retrovirus-related Pol polyprotein from transposon TNT 1-94 n=1 Tax=Capsicum annuum TaxID=4072 RepID=A0A2G2Z3V5_CAPAN|nr:hypothetical protein T459_20214 [Capsicum annuum]
MESEFIALDKASEEEEWLRNFLEDISYGPKPVALVCIHCDSQAAIGRAGSMMYNFKSHHIQQRHNTIRELLSSGIINVDYVKSKDNMSDPPTKGLSIEGVERNPREWIYGLGKVSMAVTLLADWRSQKLGSRRSNKFWSGRFNIVNYPIHSHDVENV